MKICKFRPLANETDFERLKKTLETGKFWCSKYSDLNDPMEGQFTAADINALEKIYQEKNLYKICSFTKRWALRKPIMWGYYANGFKGVAIEIETNTSKVKKVNYDENIQHIEALNDDTVEKILLTKLKYWKSECEMRYLDRTDKNEIKIGKIVQIYFCDPYAGTRNRKMIYQGSEILREYRKLRKKLVEIARKREIPFAFVGMNSKGITFDYKT